MALSFSAQFRTKDELAGNLILFIADRFFRRVKNMFFSV